MHFAKCIVDLDQRLERLGKSERLGLVSSRKARRLVSVSSRTKFSMSWSRLGLGHLGLVSRLGLGVKGLVDIPGSWLRGSRVHSVRGSFQGHECENRLYLLDCAR